ncbi:Ankyrin repeat [Macleaya cordata]|uniref:Ankyrin repeat n=1 Tax=Macleaya cordata TaxID=56857 RepID=A0A200Q8L1_MACCD|nr:Ankyrin repeat [Macleaya cordata]
MHEAVKWALEKGISRVVFESDALNIVKYLINTNDAIEWRCKSILDETIMLSTHFERIKWSFTPRTANKAADMLAKTARIQNRISCNFELPPRNIQEIYELHEHGKNAQEEDATTQTNFLDPLFLEAHENVPAPQNGEIKETHLSNSQENGQNSKDDEIKPTELVEDTLSLEVQENGLEPKDDENKAKDSVDPLLQEVREYEPSRSSQEPFDFHSQLQLNEFIGVPTDAPNVSTDVGTQNDNTGTGTGTTSTGRDFNFYLPLYKAALKGDLGSAEEFLITHDPNALNVAITGYQRTALHVAASAGHSHFVKMLVQRTHPATLEFRDSYNGDTALHFASVAGITDAAKAMVEKNNNLTQIQNKNGWTPLLLCAAYVAKEQKDMVQYLCTKTRNEEPSMPFSGHFGAQLICNITAAGLHDVVFYLVKKYPALATARDQTGCTVLDVLAQKASAFPSGSRLGFLESRIYSLIPLEVDEERVRCTNRINIHQNYSLGSGDLSSRGALIKFLSWTNLIKVPGIKQVYLKKLAHVQALELLKCICAQISLMSNQDILQFFLNSSILSTGTKFGIVELVIECIQTFPDQIWFLSMGRSIFHIAVEHRKEKIFNLMYGMSAQKKILASWRVESNNNILHLAAKLAPSPQLNTISGAALQMQRELQWFKEVEKIVQPTYKELENQDRHTPRDVFTREHKDLLEKGEKWMKDTAQSCMVVATLIATVVFAAAFTVPGGNFSDSNDQNKGIPIFLHRNSFMVFVISDALGLFFSTTSVLMFLSILTSRYAEEDFLRSLPKRLIIGLGTLFLSIAAMMIAFTAALSIVLSRRLKWASFPIAAIASLPVTLFALLQFPLLVEIFLSTYGFGIFRPDSKYKLD